MKFKLKNLTFGLGGGRVVLPEHGSLSISETLLHLPNRQFNIQAWRHFVEGLADQMGDGVQVICPFGFEVLRNPVYLTKNLQHFFIYLGLPENSRLDHDEYLTTFSSLLLGETARRYPQFYSRIKHLCGSRYKKLIAGNDTLGWKEARFLHVTTRRINRPLIKDYAHYVIGAAAGLQHDTLFESRAFHKDQLARRYVFQLFVMLTRVFESEQGKLPAAEQSLVESFAGEPIQQTPPSSTRQDDALKNIIKPWTQSLLEKLSRPAHSGEKLVSLEVQDFHGDKTLTLSIAQSLLDAKVDYIISSYTCFGCHSGE